MFYLLTQRNRSFRWAIGQLANIEQCNTERELDEALNSLPESLTETYERVLSTIKHPQDIENLRTLLCWLLHTRRPLRIEELRETIGINKFEKPHFDSRKRLSQRPKLLDQCTFLVVIDEASDMEDPFSIEVDNVQPSAGPEWQDALVLRLAHSSVVQLLERTETLSDHSRQFAIPKTEGHILIAQSCLAYMLHLDSAAAPLETAHGCPLLNYATRYWYYHVQQSETHDERLAGLIDDVLQSRWSIYRLVTYPNISTRYNPWQGSGQGENVEENAKGFSLCTVCRSISYQQLEKPRGIRHRTYASLVTSAHECRLCEMIHCALLQFGIARRCQISSRTILSLETSEILAREVDAEIRRIASNSGIITLRRETQNPFLLINYYCFFGRLHLYTSPGASLQNRGLVVANYWPLY